MGARGTRPAGTEGQTSLLSSGHHMHTTAETPSGSTTTHGGAGGERRWGALLQANSPTSTWHLLEVLKTRTGLLQSPGVCLGDPDTTCVYGKHVSGPSESFFILLIMYFLYTFGEIYAVPESCVSQILLHKKRPKGGKPCSKLPFGILSPEPSLAPST